MVRYAALKGIKNAALISGVDAYADMATREFQNSAQRHGITITETLRYNSKSMPSSDAIKKLGTSNIQGVFLPMDGQSAGVVAGLLPKTIQKMGTGLWDDPRTLSHPALDGAWFSAPSPRQFSVFEKKYRMTYGNTPPRLASLAYDATALAAVLARSGKGFGADAITGVNGFAGMDGIFRFDQNGLAERGLAIMEIRQGQVQEIDPAPTTFQRP
jgi:ABC-type branched-subunit amino acid transport system substrate-binding protein